MMSSPWGVDVATTAHVFVVPISRPAMVVPHDVFVKRRDRSAEWERCRACPYMLGSSCGVLVYIVVFASRLPGRCLFPELDDGRRWSANVEAANVAETRADFGENRTDQALFAAQVIVVAEPDVDPAQHHRVEFAVRVV